MKFPNPFKSKKPKTPDLKEFSPVAQFAQGLPPSKTFWLRTQLKLILLTLKSANRLVRTLFVAGYPRFVAANWLSPLINFDHSLRCFHVYLSG